MQERDGREGIRVVIERHAVSSTCLLVVDVQNDFAHEKGKGATLGADIQAAQRAVNQINRLILAARSGGVAVVYLRTEHSQDTDRPNYIQRYEARGFDPDDLLCATGSWGAELYEGLQRPIAREAVVTKFGYDGFMDTHLDAILRNRGASLLAVCGLVTNLCVQTTVEHGFALGYGILVVEDAVAGDDDQAHQAALRNLGAYFGAIGTTEQVLAWWRGA